MDNIDILILSHIRESREKKSLYLLNRHFILLRQAGGNDLNLVN